MILFKKNSHLKLHWYNLWLQNEFKHYPTFIQLLGGELKDVLLDLSSVEGPVDICSRISINMTYQGYILSLLYCEEAWPRFNNWSACKLRVAEGSNTESKKTGRSGACWLHLTGYITRVQPMFQGSVNQFKSFIHCTTFKSRTACSFIFLNL